MVATIVDDATKALEDVTDESWIPVMNEHFSSFTYLLL